MSGKVFPSFLHSSTNRCFTTCHDHNKYVLCYVNDENCYIKMSDEIAKNCKLLKPNNKQTKVSFRPMSLKLLPITIQPLLLHIWNWRQELLTEASSLF